MSDFDDKPIKTTEEDKFGFKPLAETVANAISNMTAPEGTVIAINGPWGSGKSSFINLVQRHLCDKTEDGDLKIVDFKCWWFRGQEALTIAFFHELYSAMKPNISQQAKKIIPKLVPQLLIGASPVVDSVAGMPGSILTAFKIITLIAKHIKQDETAEKLHKQLSDALNQGSKRYLVVIDDIDRLSQDEAMLIFQLVKAVGGLPKVIYLLAYDRQLAKEIVATRYPSEGSHYLEKIVQASFDLPEPGRMSLKREFLRRLYNVIEEKEFRNVVYFDNLYAGIIAPEIKTPRILIRILNSLKITWPAIKGEVHPTEFLCLETWRIQRPNLYAALRSNKILLTGSIDDVDFSMRQWLEEKPSPQRYTKIFLETEPSSEHERLRHGLMGLFPELERAWGDANQIVIPPDMDLQRRVCSPRHFDTYFRFSLSQHQIRRHEIEPLIQKAGDFDYIRGSFLAANEISQPDGLSRATHLLYELAIRTDDIPDDLIGDLLKAIYSIADSLLEKEGNNMWWGTVRQLDRITDELTLRRLPLETRSEVLLNACGQASLGYLSRIANGAYDQHFPTKGNRSKPQTECLMTEAHAVEINDIALARIREAKTNGSLINCPLLDRVLFLWRRVDEEEVATWISEVTDDNIAVARLAKAFISLVSKDRLLDHTMPLETALRKKLGHAVDLEQFRIRANRAMSKGNLQAEEHEILRSLLEAWQKQEHCKNNTEDV
ncbi:MAG: P-loop NTPase fold protein [Nitrospira sp.]|nr:P-loop NTPase fold protein [Nitrospira sp.]